MPYGVYLSAAGAHAQSHRMQVLSNNLANVDTPGFKPQQTILQARFAEMIEDGITPRGWGAPTTSAAVSRSKKRKPISHWPHQEHRP